MVVNATAFCPWYEERNAGQSVLATDQLEYEQLIKN